MISIEKEILRQTGASSIRNKATVQSLWGGYGEIQRYFLDGGAITSIIVKHIRMPPKSTQHPKGWNTSISHLRKLKSYQVEKIWYQEYAGKTTLSCKVPTCYQAVESDDELLLLLEDLNGVGYPMRRSPENVQMEDAKNCLSWLANFHARFMHASAKGLWETGTYWHLETRPEELTQMRNATLREAAEAIDARLTSARYQTLVHGDAKLANFCFGEGDNVAAVDFQYVGKGCGMKDVAYMMSSCFDEEACEVYEETLLNHYFSELEMILDKTIDYQSLKDEWKALYPYAWADFYRFLDGWSPGHWKMHGYSLRLTQLVIDEVNQR